METDYTKRVQLTADDLLRALPWKLRKGFLTKEQIGKEENNVKGKKVVESKR